MIGSLILYNFLEKIYRSNHNWTSNFMISLSLAGSLLFLFVLCFIFGFVFHIIFKQGPSKFILLDGFVFILGIFQIVSTPLLLLHSPFDSAFVAFWMLVFIGILILGIRRKTIYQKLTFPPIKDKFLLITGLLCLVSIAFQVGVSTYYEFSDPDDMYYIGLANTSIDSPALYTIDPSTVDPKFPVISQYRYESWELLWAILAKSFSITTAALAHTVLPPFLIVISYLSYAYLLSSLIPKKYVPFALFILSLFHLLGNYSSFSQGSYLLTRIWQGKSALLHIILPYLTAKVFSFFNSIYNKKYIWQILITLLAGISFTPVAIFLPTILIANLSLIRIIQDRKNFLIISQIGFSILPLVFYGILIKIGVTGSIPYDNTELSFVPNLQYLMFLGKGTFLYIFFIPISIFFFFRNNYEQKLLFFYFPILMLILIWNPFVAPSVARYLTSYATYWRVFWLLPIGLGISVFLTEIYIQKKYFFIFSCIVLIGILSTKNSYMYNHLVRPQNYEKIPAEYVNLAKFLENSTIENKMLLAPEEVTVPIRQVSREIRMIWSRQDYIAEFLDKGTKRGQYPRRYALAAMFTHNKGISPDEIEAGCSNLDINIIIAPKSNPMVVEKLSIFNRIYETSNYIVFYNPDI